MPTDIGLGHLKHGTELGNRELALLQQREDARAGFVAERAQVVQDGSPMRIHRYGCKHISISTGHKRRAHAKGASKGGFLSLAHVGSVGHSSSPSFSGRTGSGT